VRAFRLLLIVTVVAVSLTVLASPVLAAPPANDNLGNAENIASTPVRSSVYLIDATAEAGEPEPSCAPGHLNNSVWFTITPSITGFHRFSAIGQSTHDSLISVYTAPELIMASLGEVGCDDNSGGLVHPQLRVSLTAGIRYAIRISAYNPNGVTQHLTFRVSGPLVNDNLANAIPVASLPFSVVLDSGAGSTEVGEPRPACQTSGTLTGLTFWYTFTPATTGNYRVDTEGYDSPSTSSLEVFEAPALDYASITSVACAQFTTQAVAPQLTAGVRYAIRVASGSTIAPLNIRERSVQPMNDNLASARTIASVPFTQTTDTHAATTETGPLVETIPTCSGAAHNTIWYSFTPASTGLYRIDTIGSYRDLSAGAATTLDLFAAPTLYYSGMTSLACDRYSSGFTTLVNVNLTGGTRYAIRVGSQEPGGLGVSILNVTQLPSVPANDNIASAKAITSLPFTEALDTRSASVENGEPGQCTYSVVNNSVWYRFTPSESGNYQIDALGSSTESFVRYDVLEAASLTFGSLVPLGCGSNYGTSSGKVTVAMTAGQQYAIRSAAATAGGHTAARINVVGPLAAPANDLLTNATAITTLPFRLPIDTSSAAKEAGETISPCTTGTQENHSIWYQFTPTITGNYDLMVDDIFNLLDVYAAPNLTFASLSNIACINAFGSSSTPDDRTTTVRRPRR